MDAYPEDYIVHNLPLIILSGLEDDKEDAEIGDKSRTLLQEGGFRIKTDLSPVKTAAAQHLLQALLSHDSSDTPWSIKYAAQADSRLSCRVKSVGRVGQTPKSCSWRFCKLS